MSRTDGDNLDVCAQGTRLLNYILIDVKDDNNLKYHDNMFCDNNVLIVAVLISSNQSSNVKLCATILNLSFLSLKDKNVISGSWQLLKENYS